MQQPVRKQIWYWGIAAFLLLFSMWVLGNAILPFLMGAGVAYLMDPLADRLERQGFSRIWAVVLLTVGAVFLFVAVMVLLLPELMRQTGQLINAAPQMITQLHQFVTTHYPNLLPEGSTIGQSLSEMASKLSESSGKLLTTVLGSVLGVFGTIALLVIVPVVAFYLLLDWDHMVERIDEMLPRQHADTIRRLAREIDQALAGFVRGQIVVILILGTFYSISLGLIGLPFGFAIGALAASLSFIPYVGVLVGGATAIGVALFSFWGQPVWIGAVIAVFAIGQAVEGNYLQPKIVGGHVGLHPVWLMLALSVFGTLFGFPGLLIAVPLAAALGVLVRFAAARYKESALYTGCELPPEPAQPTLIEIVPSGTVAKEWRQAQYSHDSTVAQLRRDEHLAQLLSKAQQAPDGHQGPPSPAQLDRDAATTSDPGKDG